MVTAVVVEQNHSERGILNFVDYMNVGMICSDAGIPQFSTYVIFWIHRDS